MKFTPKNYVGHLPEGKYQGIITEQSESADKKYLWLKIAVEGEADTILNISISLNSMILNNFAKYYEDTNGEVDTEDFVDSLIDFSVQDKVVGENVYSKFATLMPVFND